MALLQICLLNHTSRHNFLIVINYLCLKPSNPNYLYLGIVFQFRLANILDNDYYITIVQILQS